MGIDLVMVRTPETIPDCYPEAVRRYPGYFRGLPDDYLFAADIFDREIERVEWPRWPPAGITEERAESLNRLYEPLSSDSSSAARPAYHGLLEARPTFRELRAVHRYRNNHERALAVVSKKPGKVPIAKFSSNDGWHITPEECLVITYRLSTYLIQKGLEIVRPTARESGGQRVLLKNRRFQLKPADTDAIQDPTPDQVLAAIDRLSKTNECLCLETASELENAFIQTLRVSNKRFDVEYAEGRPQEQFSSAKMPKDKVKALFLAYLRGDDSFKSMTEWTDITQDLFGYNRRELEWVWAFVSFNELAARHGGYRVW